MEISAPLCVTIQAVITHPMQVLSIQNLTKSYQGKTAVGGVSFSVNQGEIVGLLGPNGAGKTTTINMMLGVLAPDSGTIRIHDIDVEKNRAKAMAHTNFAAVYAQLPGNLTVVQNLRFFGMVYSVRDLPKRIETLMEEFDLLRFRDTKCGLLSSGEQTRVSLAKAMLNNPRLLLLDEPTASLDPATALDIRKRIRHYADNSGGGVLWTSHNMQEVTDMCDRVLFLSHGTILMEGDPETLPAEHGLSTLEELFIKVAKEKPEALQ